MTKKEAIAITRGAILQLRGKLNISQQDMADTLDCGQSTIRDWENGSSMPGLLWSMKIDKAYGLCLGMLLLDGHNKQLDE